MVSVSLRCLSTGTDWCLTMGLTASLERLGNCRFHGYIPAECLAVSPPLIGLVLPGILGVIKSLSTNRDG